MGNEQAKEKSPESTTREDSVDPLKQWTMSEIEAHTKANVMSILLIIHGKLYDVTKFKDEHPGGSIVLFTAKGQDATDEFEDAGHSQDAIEMMEDYLIGVVKR